MKKVPLFEADSHSTNRKYVTAKIAKIAPEAVILPDINAPEHYNRIAYKTGKPDNGLNSHTVAADKMTKDIKAKLREIGVKGSILASNYSGDDVCNAVVIFSLKDF